MKTNEKTMAEKTLVNHLTTAQPDVLALQIEALAKHIAAEAKGQPIVVLSSGSEAELPLQQYMFDKFATRIHYVSNEPQANRVAFIPKTGQFKYAPHVKDAPVHKPNKSSTLQLKAKQARQTANEAITELQKVQHSAEAKARAAESEVDPTGLEPIDSDTIPGSGLVRSVKAELAVSVSEASKKQAHVDGLIKLAEEAEALAQAEAQAEPYICVLLGTVSKMDAQLIVDVYSVFEQQAQFVHEKFGASAKVACVAVMRTLPDFQNMCKALPNSRTRVLGQSALVSGGFWLNGELLSYDATVNKFWNLETDSYCCKSLYTRLAYPSLQTIADSPDATFQVPRSILNPLELPAALYKTVFVKQHIDLDADFPFVRQLVTVQNKVFVDHEPQQVIASVGFYTPSASYLNSLASGEIADESTEIWKPVIEATAATTGANWDEKFADINKRMGYVVSDLVRKETANTASDSDDDTVVEVTEANLDKIIQLLAGSVREDIKSGDLISDSLDPNLTAEQIEALSVDDLLFMPTPTPPAPVPPPNLFPGSQARFVRPQPPTAGQGDA